MEKIKEKGEHKPYPTNLNLDDLIMNISKDTANSTYLNEWETKLGITSRYWKRNNGFDHILVSAHPPIWGWNWSLYDTLYKIKNPIWLTLEYPYSWEGGKSVDTNRLIVVPYPSENQPWVPVRKLNVDRIIKLSIIL